MSEGVQDETGRPLAEALAAGGVAERDAHGNVQLTGGDLGMEIQRALKAHFPKVRARVDTLGYLPRGFLGVIDPTDQREAFAAGAFAAERAFSESGSVVLVSMASARRPVWCRSIRWPGARVTCPAASSTALVPCRTKAALIFAAFCRRARIFSRRSCSRLQVAAEGNKPVTWLDGTIRLAGRAAVVVCLTAPFLGSGVAAAQKPVPGATIRSAADIGPFVASLWPEAERQGIPRSLFEATFAGITPDPSVYAMTGRQPEFVKPIGAYLAAQVTPSRVAAGQAMLQRWSGDLSAIERRYGVPAAILVATWGMETNYGAEFGTKDVIRSLFTLAFNNYRPPLYRTELLAALAMLNAGVPRSSLQGSWAGAMGQPQFMPSSFERYAVDQDGDGRRDIWTSVPDALGSIANFLRSQGWRPDGPWGFEVQSTRRLRLPHQPEQLRRLGGARREARRQNGVALERRGNAVLPCGIARAGLSGDGELRSSQDLQFFGRLCPQRRAACGPDDGRLGRPGLLARDPPMARDDRIALQSRLVDLGYTVDNREGRISLALRDVIRTAQESVSMTPDGNPTVALLAALKKASRKP